MSSPPKPTVTPIIGTAPIAVNPPTIINPIAPVNPTIPVNPVIGAPVIPPPGVTIPPASGGAGTSGTTTTTSGSATAPTISLTTQNPTYPAKAGDQQQAAQVVVAWDPSFANLQSLTFGLTVTDNLGSTSVQKTVTVTIQQAPVANITTPNSVVTAGSNIPLDGSTSSGVDLNYKWQLTGTTPIPSSGTS
jgi:hypothetical protein